MCFQHSVAIIVFLKFLSVFFDTKITREFQWSKTKSIRVKEIGTKTMYTINVGKFQKN